MVYGEVPGRKLCLPRAVASGNPAGGAAPVFPGGFLRSLPLAELGTAVSGSDLSGAMLDRCRNKAAARGYAVELHQSDFRELSCWAGRSFDCVASTGNSLPYVSNGQVRSVLAGMDALVREGGWLYFDLRNWNRILRERKRFYLYNPFFDGETRVNLVQAWDYHPDGTMTFNLLYTFERDQRIVQQEVFEEHYFPVPRQLLLDELARLGYGEIRLFPFPAMLRQGAEEAEWYCVLARKGPGGQRENHI